MSTTSIPPTVRRALEMLRNGLGTPLIVLALLAMVVVPLAAPVLDALFTFNIAISLMVLLAVVYVQRPLDFTIFPIVLLVTTMLRLALNVASTRVILLNGQDGQDAAGKVIASFGEFVIGGNYAVGIVVFAILTIINFVVITKGAGRVSEVAARFTLDAMPGKQMAIDADLNAGLLTREEAKARREEVREEADFYGAMDGANKFIRGDAIAGILILFINLIGGLAVGVLQHGMPFGDAAATYTLLSIGDGLVAQLPALLVSSAVALLVTRASRRQDMSQAMMGQVFGQYRALAIAAGIIGLVGLVPGMPNVAFLTLAAILAFLAWKLWKRDSAAAASAQPAAAAPGDIPGLPSSAPAATAELSWDELRPIDPLGLEVGYRLIPLVDKNQGGELMARIKGVRRKLTQDVGFLIPSVHIRDNLELPPSGYRLLVHGVPVASAEIHPDRELALDPGSALGQLDGIAGKDPAFGLDATWIQPHQRAHAESLGYTVVDPATVVATHLSHLIREHAPELLGHEEVQQLLATLAKNASRCASCARSPRHWWRTPRRPRTRPRSPPRYATHWAVSSCRRSPGWRRSFRCSPSIRNWNGSCRNPHKAMVPHWNPVSPNASIRVLPNASASRRHATSRRWCWYRARSAPHSPGWSATASPRCRYWPTAKCRRTSA